jgi:hypothetical protein
MFNERHGLDRPKRAELRGDACALRSSSQRTWRRFPERVCFVKHARRLGEAGNALKTGDL